MDDLVAKLKADPGAVSWAGGSAGGADHIMAGLIAKAIGVDPTKINYIAFSGGGEALAAILGNQVTVGVSGYGEFESQVEAGTLRLLAVSGEERIPGVDAPTLTEAGVDVALENWRMVAAAPGITPSRKRRSPPTSRRWPNPSSGGSSSPTAAGSTATRTATPSAQQLSADIAATSAILKDIGLVN